MATINSFFGGKPKAKVRRNLDQLDDNDEAEALALLGYTSEEDLYEEKVELKKQLQKDTKTKQTEYVYNLLGELVKRPKIGYKRLMEGLKDAVEPFSIMDNEEKRKGNLNDLLFLMIKKKVIDLKYESPIRGIKLHSRCLKQKDEPNCICGQENLRYLSYIEIPVEGNKTKKINNIILGSKCVENIINDHSSIYFIRQKEVIEKLNIIHKEMIDATYFKCRHCYERNRPKTTDEDKYNMDRLLYCKKCEKELNRLRGIYTRAVNNNCSWASNYKYRIDNFELI